MKKFVFIFLSVFLVTVASAQLSGSKVSPALNSQGNSNPAQGSNAHKKNYLGDYYLFNGRKARLFRSLEQVAVVYEDGMGEPAMSDVAGKKRAGKSLSRLLRLVRKKQIDILATGEVNTQEEMDAVVASLNAEPSVKSAHPVFINGDSGLRQALTDEILVKVSPGTSEGQLKQLISPYGASIVELIKGTTDEYLLEVKNPKQKDALSIANGLAGSTLITWAEPNFENEVGFDFMPNDTNFGDQWHLNNTGQGGGTIDADIDAPEAWDLAKGDNIVIAVLDDGVETSHEDLAANIWSNPGETPGDGKDDDHNGYIDDVNGWNFVGNTNDPNPSDPDDKHGTAVAGAAAARGNNAMGVSGSAPNAKILPVKIVTGAKWCSNLVMGSAIRYAADKADIINGSWETPESSLIDSAITYAVTKGRNGKGCPCFFAAGNNAFGWRQYTLTGIPAGNHTFRWRYVKDASNSYNLDTVYIDDITYQDNTTEGFEGGALPAGWATGGDANWGVVIDGHTHEGTHSVKAGNIGDNQSTWIEVQKNIGVAGDLVFWAYVSTEKDCDMMYFSEDGVGINNFTSSGPARLSYPARNANTIAVGASTNFDLRANYSRYGPELDFVAPGGMGGTNTSAFITTDRTGAAGYDAGNYTANADALAGTSFSSPLAAGVGALLLSVRPDLTASQVRKLMRATTDKVGPVTYDAKGFNMEYGYGRLNAFNLLNSVTPFHTVITLPANNATISGPAYTLIGTASGDGVGIQKVEVSTNNGADWHSATDTSGNGSWSGWSYSWILPADGSYTILVRATDNLGIPESPVSEAQVNISRSGTSRKMFCGMCHSVPPVDEDNCAGDARGLHGVHYNYSSFTYRNLPDYGKCAYCHPSTTTNTATLTHNNNVVDFASPEPAYNTGTKVCSQACHNNRNVTATWGPFNSPAVQLACRGCHDDVTDKGQGDYALSGAHKKHLTTNISTARGPRMSRADNSVCVNCHPDNRDDHWSQGQADDGSRKAYPHASDGTNVISDNASVLSNLSTRRVAGPGDTCANACHKSQTASWNAGRLYCTSCHFYSMGPTDINNKADRVPLSGGHNPHFKAPYNYYCDKCHVVPPDGDTSHVKSLPPVPSNATVLASLNYSPVSKSCWTTPSGCHGTYITPGWGSTGAGCAICHRYPGGDGHGGGDWPTGNGHASRHDGVANRHLPTAAFFNRTGDTYLKVVSDVAKCGLCHMSVVDSTHKDGKVRFNPQGHAACGTGAFTIITTLGEYYGTCINVDCHKGKTTPSFQE